MKSIQYLSIAISIVFLLNTNILFASPICGELKNSFGPFDYTNPKNSESLEIVELHHFNSDVEQLRRGLSASLEGDLHYVLMAFPNHHRALNAMSKLALKTQKARPLDQSYTALCYFERAVRFKPNDTIVRALFSNHLLKINNTDMALEQLLFAADVEPDNPTNNYNIGLLYMKKKEYDKALHYAKKAYASGFPLPGLKNQLTAVGKWK